MSRRSEIAAVLLEHSYDHQIGECICGFAATGVLSLAMHVAEKVEVALGADAP